jgi:hypothetical protein
MRASKSDLTRSLMKRSLDAILPRESSASAVRRCVRENEPLPVTACGRHIQRALAYDMCPCRPLGSAPQHGKVGM